jgi:hypothetical protein
MIASSLTAASPDPVMLSVDSMSANLRFDPHFAAPPSARASWRPKQPAPNEPVPRASHAKVLDPPVASPLLSAFRFW